MFQTLIDLIVFVNVNLLACIPYLITLILLGVPFFVFSYTNRVFIGGIKLTYRYRLKGGNTYPIEIFARSDWKLKNVGTSKFWDGFMETDGYHFRRAMQHLDEEFFKANPHLSNVRFHQLSIFNQFRYFLDFSRYVYLRGEKHDSYNQPEYTADDTNSAALGRSAWFAFSILSVFPTLVCIAGLLFSMLWSSTTDTITSPLSSHVKNVIHTTLPTYLSKHEFTTEKSVVSKTRILSVKPIPLCDNCSSNSASYEVALKMEESAAKAAGLDSGDVTFKVSVNQLLNEEKLKSYAWFNQEFKVEIFHGLSAYKKYTVGNISPRNLEVNLIALSNGR